MSQGALVIPTTGTLSGLQLVNAINAAVDNLVTKASGSTDPSTLSGGVQPYSFWLDTSVFPNVLRMRNAANTAWAAMGTISSNNFVPDLSNADIATALGYTPVNKAGDSLTGDLDAPNLTATTKAEALIIKANTKFVFPDNTEQTTAAITAFNSGTVMLFVQSAAPTGWTKSTAHNDKALRVVSGSVSSGGSASFSTVFSSILNVSATTLSSSQIPVHNHIDGNDEQVQFGRYGGVNTGIGGPIGDNDNGYGNNGSYTSSTGGGGSHTHSLPSFAVQYVDVIICTKD